MKRPRTLSATFAGRVSQPGFCGDGRGGHGLSLLVKRMAGTGRVSKSWCQKIRLGGKPRNIEEPLPRGARAVHHRRRGR